MKRHPTPHAPAAAVPAAATPAAATPGATNRAAPARPAVKPASAAATRRAVLLGSRKVSFLGDRDVVQVGPARGGFDGLKLHVSGSPLEMYDVRVVFGDGTAYSPETRLHFDQGSWTRSIDLPGNSRQIRRIEFRYRSVGVRTGRATVQLFGLS